MDSRPESSRQPEPLGSRGPRRWWVWAASAVVVLLVGVVNWSPWSGDPEDAAPTPMVTVTMSTPVTTAPSTDSSTSTPAQQPLTVEGLAADLVDVVPPSLAASTGRPVGRRLGL